MDAASWWQSALQFVGVQGSRIQLAMAVALLALLVGGWWVVSNNRELRRQLEQNRQAKAELEEKQRAIEERLAQARSTTAQSVSQLEIEHQRLAQLQQERDALEAQLTELSSGARNVVSLGLFAGVRGSNNQPKSLIVPRETAAIELKLYFEGAGNYESYRAELRTAGSKVIFSKDRLPVRKTASGNSAVLRFAASILQSGEYEVVLRGVRSKGQLEDVEYYYFKAVKK